MRRRDNEFQTIHSAGGLLPTDLLRRILDPQENLPGTSPEAYGLPEGERLNEAITHSWNRLRRHWSEFRAAVQKLPEHEPGTGLTNDRWNIPLLRELGFGMLPTSPGPELDGRNYAVNRFFGTTAIHLVGCNLSLDRRAAGVRGATAANPHGLVQELLNRSPDHGWGIVSNGLLLRILRDNQALSRQSYLEFDLEAMFDGEVFADFVLFWLMTHATRFTPQEERSPESCWLEQWTKLANEQGTRALGELRLGVEKALTILGQGFTDHPRNTLLRECLRSGSLSLDEFHGQLLRVVYRLIFLFVAEDRAIEGIPVLHPRDETEQGRQARAIYASHYSTGRLRVLSANIKGSRHGDLWHQFNLLVGALSGDERFAAARAQLALPILGSYLWSPQSTSQLNAPNLNDGTGAVLTNGDFLEVIRNLSFIRQDKVLRPVDYKNLGAEELGGVYESLLALTPQISSDGARFTFAEFAGNIRKTSGSYYTPDSLVQCLLDSALDPVVEEAIKGKKGPEAEQAILSLKVCDPAVGSGHFLVGAAHRLARHLARVRALAQGESEPSPLLYQQALRVVIGRCLYGVDVNPMAAELCRVSLWLEALEPGKPLSFLDHHIRVGNSLLGTTPELITAGLPDDAFKPIEGDEKTACTLLKKRNKSEREGMGPILTQIHAESQAALQQVAAALEVLPDDRPEDISAIEMAFRDHEQTEHYQQKKKLADAWCAAFMIRKYFREPGYDESVSGITQGRLNDLAIGMPMPADLVAEVEQLTDQFQYFHWHLAFPEVFDKGGFDCVLGNPPWERVKLQEKEWFAERSPEIANAANAAARKRLIEELKAGDPELYQRFLSDSRKAEGESHFLRNSGRYPLCGRGDINLYAVFAEGMRYLLNDTGRVGCVLPTGIATDDTTKLFFQDVVEKKSLVSLFDFENGKYIFKDVQGNIKFCLFTLSAIPKLEFEIAAQLDDPTLLSKDNRRYNLSVEDIQAVNPNTFNCPTFRLTTDALLVISIHRRHPILINESGGKNSNPWLVSFMSMFHMTNDSSYFKTFEELNDIGATRNGNMYYHSEEEYFPLYEAKLVHQFNHRSATFEGISVSNRFKIHAGTISPSGAELSDPEWNPLPRFWVNKQELNRRCDPNRYYLSGFRNAISATADSRSLVACVFPYAGVGNSMPLYHSELSVFSTAVITSFLNSFVTDYVLRQKASGGNLNFYILKQIPVIDPVLLKQPSLWNDVQTSLTNWLLPRILELTYTSWDLETFSRDCGWDGPPFRWNEERRFLLRCELDAAFFHLYLPAEANGEWRHARKADGCPHDETQEQLAELKHHFPTPRHAVAYIMGTFPIVRRKDEERHDGDYRTKRVILEIYDAMQEAIRTGRPYQTPLDPPPADPSCCHPPRD